MAEPPVVYFDVYSWNDPDTLIDTFTDQDIEDAEWFDALSDFGSFRFRINRRNEHATPTNLHWGNTIKIRVPQIKVNPMVAYILSTSDDLLASEEEEGGEHIERGGLGLLAWLRDAVVLEESYHGGAGYDAVEIADGSWTWTDTHPAAIMRRLIAEDDAKGASALAHLNPNFSDVNDTDSNPWPAFEGDVSLSIGSDLWEAYNTLREAEEFDLFIGPTNYRLNAYLHRGTDRSSSSFAAGKVRWVVSTSESNVLTDISRNMEGWIRATHAMVGGKDDVYVHVTDPDFSSGDRVRRIFVPYESKNVNLLERVGLRALSKRVTRQDSVEFEIAPGDDELNGLYLPTVHFGPGDDATIHTGTSPAQHDFDNATKRITGYRVTLDEAVRGVDDAGADDDEAAHRSLHVVVELDGEPITDSGVDNGGFSPGTPNVCRNCGGTDFPPTCEAQEPDTETVLSDSSVGDWGGTVTTGSCWSGDPHKLIGGSGMTSTAVVVTAGDTVRGSVNFRDETGNDAWENVSNYNYRANLRFSKSGGGAPNIDYVIVNQRYHLAGCINVTHSIDKIVPVGYDRAQIVILSRLGGYQFNGKISAITIADPVDNDPDCLSDPGDSPYPPHSDDPRFDAADQHLTTKIQDNLTNNSGAELAIGDVVIHDITDDLAVTTDTDAASTEERGIVTTAMGDGESGSVMWAGLFRQKVNVNGATTAHGDYLYPSATAKAADPDSVRDEGAVGRAVRVDADDEPIYTHWWGVPIGGSGGGGGSGHTIKENGTPLTARAGLNFGTGLVATDDAGNNETDVVLDDTYVDGIADVSSAAAVAVHAAAGDPHAGYMLESLASAKGELWGASANDVPAMVAASTEGQHLVGRAAATAGNAFETQYGAIEVEIDGGGATITTGVKAYIKVPFDFEIVRASLMGNTSGSIVIDVWRDSWAAFLAGTLVAADSICASAKPTVSGARGAEDATLTGWSKTCTDGQVLAINVDSVATFQKVTLELRYKRS